MKTIIKIIAVLLCMSLISCTHNIKDDFNINTKPPQYQETFIVSLYPELSQTLKDENAVLEIKDKKTGKKWSITYKQFMILDRSFENWQIVSKNKPVITKVEEKNNKVTITFNYNNTDDKSILSGQIIIDKDKASIIFDDDKWKDYYIIGSTTYSVLLTILFAIMFAL